MTRVLIAGVSTRAAADSAARAGFTVTAIDGYADRDQHPAVRAVALPRDLGTPFTARHAAAAAAAMDVDAVAYLSNFENDPTAVEILTGNRALWGNPPDVLHRAREPFTVTQLFRAHGVPSPNVSNDPNDPNSPNEWLLKPLSSGGGHGIRQWRGSAIPAGGYLQQRIEGTPGSVVFVAAAGRARVVGVSRQLIGDHRFGSAGYRYCGNILAPIHDPQFANGTILFSAAHALATIAASGLNLVGMNGIDFVARAGVPYPIEINPRWSASMELVERALGINLFAAHGAACARGELPDLLVPPGRAFGKAIVFAREPCVAGETDGWLADADIRDVPHPGDPIAAGSPVCTVFADTDSAASCEAALVARAERVFADMRRWDCTLHDSPFAVHDLND